MSGVPDALIYAVGYERRSRHIASSVARGVELKIGIGFQSRQVGSFAANGRFARDSGVFLDLGHSAFERWVSDELHDVLGEARSIAVDVSSFSRDRLAALIAFLWSRLTAHKCLEELVFMYAPGAFDDAALPSRHTVVASAELLKGFEGGWSDPERPATAIIGLGYEPGRALGAVELLEPESTVLLVPTGVDVRYDRQVEIVNRPLLASDAGTVPLIYDVMRPEFLLAELLRLIQGCAVHGRAVLVPLGPKIFAAMAYVASLLAEPAVPVWRLSGGDSEEPRDIAAEGSVANVAFRRNN